MAAVDTGVLADQVRARVRDEGIDPVRQVAVVRRIAEQVARAHDDRSLTGAVAPLDDVPAVVGALVDRVAGFGPLQPYLDDDTVEEIWINDPAKVRYGYPNRLPDRADGHLSSDLRADLPRRRRHRPRREASAR